MTTHPRGPWTITLNYPRPPYGLAANDRPKHWAIRHKATQAVRTEVMARVRAAHVPALERCKVEIVWVVRDHRTRDVDNLSFFEKAIFDGIGSNRGISARIVDDDSPAFMEKARPVIVIDRTAPTAHFTVTITDLGPAD